MLENLQAEKKIFKIAIGLLLLCYVVAYGYSVWKVEPTEVGSIYNGEPRAFADNRIFKMGEEEKIKSFLQATFALKLYLFEEKVSYFPIYKKTLAASETPVVEIEDGVIMTWSMPKIESVAVGYLGVTMSGDSEAELKYLDSNNKIQKIVGVKK